MERHLDDWLTSYMKYTENTEPPDLFRLWCGISAIAAMLQRRCWLPWGSITFYTNLYVVLVAPSGRARKGTAISPMLDFLEKLQVSLAAESITREALIKTLCDSLDSVSDPETGAQDFHSSLTVIAPELTVFLGYQNHQLMSDLSDWYDCRSRWTYRTKNMGTDDIVGVWVNILGATTPELIRTTLPLDAIGGGLTSRIIFVFEEKRGRRIATPFFSEDEKSLHKDLLYDLEQMLMLQGTFKVNQDFLKLWIEWYNTRSDVVSFTDPHFNGYIQRRPNHVMKLSMILSASRRNTLAITGQDFTDALAILEQTELKMPDTFSGVGRLSHAEIIPQVMALLSNEQKMSFSDLLAHFYRDVDRRTLEDIMMSIESIGFAKKILTNDGVFYCHHDYVDKINEDEEN